MSRECTKINHTLSGKTFIFGLLFCLPPTHATSDTDAAIRGSSVCSQLEETALQTTVNHSGGDVRRCFDFSMERAGYVLLDVLTQITRGIELQVDLVTDSCDGKMTDNYRWVAITPTSGLLATRPGRHVFCVAPQDPRHLLPNFRLRTAVLETEFEKGGDPLVIEPDPDPFADCSTNSAPPECAAKGGAHFLRRTWAKLCESNEPDDHGDGFTCATPMALKSPMAGELTKGTPDDVDFFTFVLTERRTVSIITSGDSDTVGALYDRHGHRLAFDDDDGEGDNFRIVKTLAAGRYVVSVESGLRGAATYSLQVGKPVQ